MSWSRPRERLQTRKRSVSFAVAPKLGSRLSLIIKE
jgi:hypothetical protein